MNFLFVMILSGVVFASHAQTETPETNFGYPVPGENPVIFGNGQFSSVYDEFNAAFDTKNSRMYYSIRKGWGKFIILYREFQDDKWTDPTVAGFSGKYRDADPFISPDGNILIFCSDRPTSETDNYPDWNIWMCKRNGISWGNPEILSFNTSDRNEMYPTMSENGNIYFHADYEGTKKPLDIMQTNIYMAKLQDGIMQYSTPEKLPLAVCSDKLPEWDPFISPDEKYIIFTTMKPGDLGGGDMYISFRDQNGNWQEAQNMGPEINSSELDYCPNLSPDGEYLFFSSYRNSSLSENAEVHEFLGPFHPGQNGRQGNIYWIKISAITGN